MRAWPASACGARTILYVLPNADISEHQTLAEACKRVPHGVVCLLSALRFHGLTTQSPHEMWLAIGSKVWRPQVDHPRLRFVRFASRALQAGVEEHTIEGVVVRVYNPAKTVADCFKWNLLLSIHQEGQFLHAQIFEKLATPTQRLQIDQPGDSEGVVKPAGDIQFLEGTQAASRWQVARPRSRLRN